MAAEAPYMLEIYQIIPKCYMWELEAAWNYYNFLTLIAKKAVLLELML